MRVKLLMPLRPAFPPYLVVLEVAAVLMAVGCTAARHTASVSPSPTGTASRAVSLGVAPASSGPSTGARHRTVRCSDAIYGQLGSGWRRGAVNVGPISFNVLREMANAPFPERDSQGYGSFKSQAVVKRGVTVKVALAGSGVSEASLDYHSHNGSSEGHNVRTTTFVACPRVAVHGPSTAGLKAPTVFGGAFLVKRPACIPLKITVLSGPPPRDTVMSSRMVVVSFSAGDCHRHLARVRR